MRKGLSIVCMFLAASLSAQDDAPGAAAARHKEIRASAELSAIQKRIDTGQLPKIGFDFDSAQLRADGYPALDLIAEFLLSHKSLKIRITANTSSEGGADYNQKLSERRAKAVKGYLVKKGVPPPSIRFKGYGASQPVASNDAEEGREKNRRVEFSLIRREWDSVY